jgi:hypothetical protein
LDVDESVDWPSKGDHRQCTASDDVKPRVELPMAPDRAGGQLSSAQRLANVINQ